MKSVALTDDVVKDTNYSTTFIYNFTQGLIVTTLEKTEEKENSYSQNYFLALQLEGSAHCAPFLVVLIQTSKDSAGSSASVSDEHRSCVHCEAFCGQLVHVSNIFQAGDVFLKENLMGFKHLRLSVIKRCCVYSNCLDLAIAYQPTRGVGVNTYASNGCVSLITK